MTTVQEYPLEKSKIIKKTIKSTFYMYIFFLIGPLWANIFLWNLYQIPLLVLDVLFILFPFIEFVYQGEYYKKYFYDIKDDFLTIRKGVFTPNETVLPYDKLQDVYIDQDIFDRVFRLCDVHVSTATVMSGVQAHIDGLSMENGKTLREMILDNIRSHQKK